jgi:hypothetical protein
MPLAFTDDTTENMGRKLFRATGSRGGPVIVEVSHEALQDYGEARALQRASDKYDAGQVSNGRVTVLTSDLSR